MFHVKTLLKLNTYKITPDTITQDVVAARRQAPRFCAVSPSLQGIERMGKMPAHAHTWKH